MKTRKVIVTVAPTGGLATKADNPHLPTQPEEIAADVKRAYDAGASLAALHARRPDDQATCDPAIYRRINALVRERCDIVINNSTGGGANGDMVRPDAGPICEVDWEARMAGLGGGAEMCTMDAITFTASLLGREVLMHTPPSRARQMAQRMQALGIKPEWEAFTHNHLLQDARTLIAAGFDRPPYCFNICVGLDRIFQGALPWTPRLLQSMVDELPPQSVFNVSAIGPDHVHAITHALLLGGHIRVGLEDCLFYAPDEPATNVRMVERAVRLVRELGFEPATPAEARAILGLEARHG